MTHQLLHLGNLSDLDYEGSCMQCLMQLTFWWNTLVPSIWKKSDIREWRHGSRNGESLGLQTKRTIINPERFLYSGANMNPNAIKLLTRDDIQPELRTTLEGRVAYHQECQERNKRQKKT